MTQAQIDAIRAVIVQLNEQIRALEVLLPVEENKWGSVED